MNRCSTRGGDYADGAVLVFDLLDAAADGHATAEGGRILLGVMEKDRARHGTAGLGIRRLGRRQPQRRAGPERWPVVLRLPRGGTANG